MIIKYNVQGKERKRLAHVIADHLDSKVVYAGAPTFAFKVDCCTIDYDGNLIFDEKTTNPEVIEDILEMLASKKYVVNNSDEGPVLNITVILDETDTETFDKVQGIITSKSTLLKHAFCINNLTVERTNEGIYFPWFSVNSTVMEKLAYRQFTTSLVRMAKEAKRVVVKERPVENEKYAFRCFLLRLGFIGDRYKQTRKILLNNLSGSSAFKRGRGAE